MIFAAYFFMYYFSPNNIIDIIHKYNKYFIFFSFILLYLLGVDNNYINSLKPVREDIILTGTDEMENELRGMRLTYGSSLMFFSYAFYRARFYLLNDKRSLFNIILIIVYFFFIHKGRTALVGCFLIWIFPYIIKFNTKAFIKLFCLFLFILLSFIFIPQLSSRFLVVLDLFGLEASAGTNDFSGIARLNEILLAWPLIKENPIFGVGNLSYHYNNGFIGYFINHFYIADIGIVGSLLIGGIFLICVYFLFYKNLIKIACDISNFQIKYCVILMVLYYLILNFLGSDILFNRPINIALLIFFCNINRNYQYPKLYK